MTKIAFLGTGAMGLPIAQNLLRAGFDVHAWNRSPERAEPLARDGAEVAEAPARVSLVDAPVLGTREPAEQAKLVVLASGSSANRDACEPIFDAISQRVLWLGEAGAGSKCKVVVNSWIVGVVGLLAETITLAEALGIDPNSFFDAIEGGPLDLPYARMKGKAMIERSFDDAAFRLALSRKDADLVLEAAGRADLETPIMEAVLERLRRAESAGHGEKDMAATYFATAPESASGA